MEDFYETLRGVDGRIPRMKYWKLFFLYGVGATLLLYLSIFAGSFFDPQAPFTDSFRSMRAFAGSMIYFFAFMAAFIFIVACFFLTVRRLHDRDKNGWWLMLFGWLPLTPAAIDAPAVQTPLELASAALVIWGLVELFCLRGTAEPNKYGPDPLQTEQ